VTGRAVGGAATVALALLATACGGSPSGHVAQLGTTTSKSDTSTSSSQQSGAVAFSECMRAHGVSEFPDPNSSGAIPKVNLQQLGVSSSQFQQVQTACRHLLPSTNVEDSVTECLSTPKASSSPAACATTG
jgi:hypothetical protein